MKARKGQVSIEYLMNYGWAFLVLAIVIAAIFATGAFNPNYYAMEECYLGSSFNCHSQLVQNATRPGVDAYINITNALGYPVRLNNLTFALEDSGATSIQTLALGTKLNNTESIIPSAAPLYSSSLIPKGTGKKVLMTLTYYICAEEVNPDCGTDPNYLRTISGRITSQISEPG